MTIENHSYHREREQHCRAMADMAADPEIRRRHEELASLHADRAATFGGFGNSGTALSAA